MSAINFSELSRVIEQVGKDRGIKREVLVEALEQAVLLAAQKKFGEDAQLEAHYNPDTGEIDLFQFKTVVETDEDVGDEDTEIYLEAARKLDSEVNIGDELGIKLDTPTFGRIDAQTAKQVIFQKVRDAERDLIFGEFIHRKGEIISGIARRAERGNVVIDLGKTDALLPRNEIIPGEVFKPGDRVQAFLSDVVMTPKGPQLYLTRTSPKFLIKLFETEVPEVRDGIVEIKAAAREPGSRAKIAVISNDRDVDPVGACVGMKGVRVQTVIQELRGERIDIVPWSEIPAYFVRAALQPAEIASITPNEANRTMEIVVEDSQLSLAIGKRGQNVRLAAMLTGWRLDISSKTNLQKRTADALYNLKHIEGVSDTLAQGLYQSGFSNVFQVAEAPLEALMKVPGYSSEEEAKLLQERAAAAIEKGGDALKVIAPTKDGATADASKTTIDNQKDAKTLAEERLKEAMASADQTHEEGKEH